LALALALALDGSVQLGAARGGVSAALVLALVRERGCADFGRWRTLLPSTEISSTASVQPPNSVAQPLSIDRIQ